MRISEFKKQQSQENISILTKEYLPEIKKVWVRYGHDPDYLLDVNNDFHNILTDYHKSKQEIRDMANPRYTLGQERMEDYMFRVTEDVTTYRILYDKAKAYLCGFYRTDKKRYFSVNETALYAEWYLANIWCSRKEYIGNARENTSHYDFMSHKYDSYLGKYQAIFSNIAALLIAADVTQYLDEKKICDKNITKSNVDKFLQYGPQAGYIFDPETMEYRKPENFEEFTHHLHTQYWFHDPAKGYHIDAPYKWDPDVPMPEELT